MINIKSLLATIALTIPLTTAYADTSVSLSTGSVSNPIKAPEKVTMSICRTGTSRLVVPGRRLQPSNDCRIVNYYTGKKWVGALRIPEGIEFQVPWAPYALK